MKSLVQGILLLIAVSAAQGQVASGFYVTNRGGGLTTYRKDWQGGNPDFVSVVKLDSGGTIKSLTGNWRGTEVENMVWSTYKAMAWNNNSASAEAYAVFNGTFFGKHGLYGQVTDLMPWQSTPISFGLKTGGNISYGWDTAQYSEVRLLRFNNGSASVSDHSVNAFGSWADVIGGYKESHSYNDNVLDRRNWFGVRDSDGNGSLDTVVFFFSISATKAEVKAALEGFGCPTSSMGYLDVGKSSGYWSKGIGDVVSPTLRGIPHAIAVYASPPQNSAAYVADINYPDGTSVAPGAQFTKVWRIRNSGNTTWGGNNNASDGYHWTFNSGAQMGGVSQIDAPPVNPGQTWDPSVTLQAPTSPGLYRGYWQMTSPAGNAFGTRCWVEIRVNAAPSEVVVDQSDAASSNGAVGFWKWGTPAYWHTATGLGINGSMLWTYNNDPAHGIDNMGDWRPNLSQTRSYEVFVFIPRNYATTPQARYEIYHAGGRTDRTINQLAYYDVWVSLGTYTFNAGTGGFVRLIDLTSDPYISKKIGFDAMKWVPR